MAIFSVASERKLATVDLRLQQVLREAIKRIDFAVVYGYRSPDEQFELFKKGRTERNGRWMITDPRAVATYCDGKKKPSKHNRRPSAAVDIVPCGPNGKPTWDDIPAFERLAGIVLDEARRFSIKIVWGGSWKMKDRPHFEVR